MSGPIFRRYWRFRESVKCASRVVEQLQSARFVTGDDAGLDVVENSLKKLLLGLERNLRVSFFLVTSRSSSRVSSFDAT